MIEECEKALQEFAGDMIEIGAGYGANTVLFLGLAEKYSRQVIVIDPFEAGWGNMPETYRYASNIFYSTTEKLKHRLVVHEINSLSEQAEKVCFNKALAFAYVDGLQFKGAVLNDLRIVSHASVICVDDMDRHTGESQVQPAVYEFIKQNNKTLEIKGRWAFIR